ncbi:hypothetical protein D3C84_543090 [compost metagenome]
MAEARLALSSVQVAVCGRMLMPPIRPFCPCLMTSAGVMLRPPNSMAVVLMLSTERPICITGLPSRSRCPA